MGDHEWAPCRSARCLGRLHRGKIGT
jgi:hypothetical protein